MHSFDAGAFVAWDIAVCTEMNGKRLDWRRATTHLPKIRNGAKAI